MFNKALWQFYVLRHLIAKATHYKVIHVCDIESVMPALFMKLFGKKVVLDIYDSAFPKFERFSAKHLVDLLILPTVKRLKQLNMIQGEPRGFLEVENVPTFDYQACKQWDNKNDHIRLSYVGTFEKNIRGLENLIKEVEDNEMLCLDIAGTGAGLDEYVKEVAKRCKRINYHGVVDYQKGLSIMSRSDFIVAMYYNVIPNHTYASPNKYYESLYLGVPVITTKGTLVGDNVEKNHIGYAIGETQKDIHDILEETRSIEGKKEYDLMKNNCHNLWQTQYADYFDKKLCKEYISTLQHIAD